MDEFSRRNKLETKNGIDLKEFRFTIRFLLQNPEKITKRTYNLGMIGIYFSVGRVTNGVRFLPTQFTVGQGSTKRNLKFLYSLDKLSLTESILKEL